MKTKSFIKFFLLEAICFAFSFATFSCSDLIGENLKNNSDDFATSDDFSETNFFEISGNFCVNGAVPSEIAASFSDAADCNIKAESSSSETESSSINTNTAENQTRNSRTAFPSISESSLYYKVTATKSGSSSSSSVSGEVNQSSKTFTIKLSSGTWNIKAQGFSSSSMSESTKILEGQTQVTLGSNAVKNNIKITLEPISSGSGKLNLSVNYENTGISNIEMILTKRSSSGTSSANPITIKTQGSSPMLLSHQNIPSGIYDAQIKFSGSNVNYVAWELVNVFQNLTTDTWQGNSPYFSQENGKTIFKLTKQIVDDFNLKTFYVQGTSGTYTPQSQASDSNIGTYFDPLSSMQSAINRIQSKNDGTSSYKIIVDGTVTKALTTLGTSVASISPTKNLTLVIEGKTSSAKIQADTSTNASSYGSVFDIDQLNFSSANINLEIKNLTLTGGKLTGANVTYNGAAINLKSGNLTLSGVTVTNNNSTGGSFAGGIYVASGATLTLENNSQIKSNSATQNGGGIYVASGGTLNVNTATISQNKSSQDGAGIYIEQDATVNLTNATISQNSGTGDVSFGGGIYSKSGVNITGGTISGNNVVLQRGGGIYFDSSEDLILDSVSFSSNSASNGGSSIFMKNNMGDLILKGSVKTYSNKNEDIMLEIEKNQVISKSPINIQGELSQSKVAILSFVWGKSSGTETPYEALATVNDGKTQIIFDSPADYSSKFGTVQSGYKIQFIGALIGDNITTVFYGYLQKN